VLPGAVAMRRDFLIDSDGGADDAVALIMAMRSADTRIAAITTVAGNVDVDQATRNVLAAVELCGADIPVYRGAQKPLERAHQDATSYHGRDGLGDQGFAPRQRQAEPQAAVDAMLAAIENNPGIHLVTLGPLTNLALALKCSPKIFDRIGRCVVMGGAPCCEGNVTPAAEYNFWADPEAAREVFRSRIPIELIGWQLSRGNAVLNASEIETILKMDTELARFVIQSNRCARQAYLERTGEDGIALPDGVAMAVALDESVGLSWSEHFTDIEIQSELTRGMSVVDRWHMAGNSRNREVWAPLLNGGRKARVCWEIDTKRWKQLLCSALKQMQG
jgi:purine nucleosidase